MRLADIARSGEGRISHSVISLDGDLTARSAAPGASFEALVAKKSRAVSVSNLLALRRKIAAARPDVLCTYNFGALEAAIANAAGLRAPHIHHEDGFGPDETLERQKTRRVLMRRLTLGRSLVVVPSQTLKTLAVGRWKLSPSQVRYVPNGVDIARFACPARAPRSGPVVVGFVGALRPEKNVARLIRAFSKIAPSDAARLMIYGDGPERSALERLAAGSGAADRIAFRGATSRPEDAYTEFDVFALSSDTEQMPLSMMEAMAAGLPVAAMGVGDVAQMASIENRPFIAPEGDEAAFEAALSMMVLDDALRRRLGAANAERARREFSIERMVAAHFAIYDEARAASR